MPSSPALARSFERSLKEGWRIHGGHRLWLAPENPETYFPDNQSIEFIQTRDGSILRQEADPWLLVQKEIEVIFAEDSPRVRVVHRVTNIGPQARELSLWAITALRDGGVQKIPYGAPDTGMAPNRFISFWPDSDPADERLHLSYDTITLDHKPLQRKFKMGMNNYSGTASYDVAGMRFSKRYSHDPASRYPDNNVSYQTFMCMHMVEMETLSPLHKLNQGESASHSEEWNITDMSPRKP